MSHCRVIVYCDVCTDVNATPIPLFSAWPACRGGVYRGSSYVDLRSANEYVYSGIDMQQDIWILASHPNTRICLTSKRVGKLYPGFTKRLGWTSNPVPYDDEVSTDPLSQ